MKAIIDREGRIALDHEVQQQLGVQPGDEVVLEPRGAEVVIKAAHGKTGLCYEGNVLVHRGTCVRKTNPLADNREERMDQLGQGLPQ
jgi:formylmethanofuran dehydrogenase subunit D